MGCRGLQPERTTSNCSEVVLGQPQYLFRLEVIDVGSDVGDHLGCDVLAVFFDVGNPVMRRVGLPSSVSQQQDCSRGRQGLGELVPVRRTVALVRTRRISRTMVDLVKVPVLIRCNETLGPLARCGVGHVDDGLVKVDGSDNVLPADLLPVVRHGQTSLPFSSSSAAMVA
jgi:hypothetical protein